MVIEAPALALAVIRSKSGVLTPLARMLAGMPHVGGKETPWNA